MPEATRILRLYISDFQRITVVDITPRADATVVTVAGENESGKSSLLNGIATLIEGIGGITVNGAKPQDLVRHGSEQAKLSADIGYANGKRKYTVERTVNAERKATLVIKNADGKRIASTQAFLDDLAGSLGFDPGAFIEMDSESQFEELRRIANLGPEIDKIDKANADDYAARTDFGRRAKESKAAGELIEVPDGLPDQRVDVAKLMDQMKAINARNKATEHEHGLREGIRARVTDLRQRSEKFKADLAPTILKIEKKRDEDISHYEAQIADFEEQISRLRKRIASTQEVAVKDIAETTDLYEHQSQVMRMEADAAEKDLATAAPLSPLETTDHIQELVESADEANRGIAQRDRRCELMLAYRNAEAKVKELTGAMEERELHKRNIIAAAKLPVEGLGLGEKCVTVNGIPFSSLSDGQKWKIAASIAMGSDKELRIVLIRRASLIDAKNLEIIRGIAKEREYQVFEEVVGPSIADGAIVMVEGHLEGKTESVPQLQPSVKRILEEAGPNDLPF